jgi:ADP-ribose pyrophosphatase YjhB (NUDIX family)
MARAILVDNGRLLCNSANGYLALFGGRVEKGETVRRALARELDEELGLPVEIGRLAYQIENFFVDAGGRKRHELGLYYVTRSLRRLGERVEARERGFAPTWLPLESVAASRLMPRPLRGRLARDLEAAKPELVELVEIDREAFPEVS